MNQVADETFQNIQCNKIKMKNKSKKAKDRSEENDEKSLLNQVDLSETLANTLHINNSNNLTNGTSDHSHGGSPSEQDCKMSQGETASEHSTDVNSVVCSDAATSEESKETATQQVINHMIDDALENIENAHNKREQSLQDEIEIVSYKSELQVPATQQAINGIIDNALENLENACEKQDQSLQDEINIVSYESEHQMPEIMRLIQKDLSEPYSIYTYRYFIHNWPKLCFLAKHEGKCIGAIVCKLDMHRNVVKRGYIAMLAVDEKYRSRKIGSRLAQKAIKAMINDNADEVVLETEITNRPALKLYENLGFVRDKRLFRYYLNGVDALRLKLWLR